jgi:hypothetical protein
MTAKFVPVHDYFRCQLSLLELQAINECLLYYRSEQPDLFQTQRDLAADLHEILRQFRDRE